MSPAATAAILGTGALLSTLMSPLPDEVPENIVRSAESFAVERMGEAIYREYLTFRTAKLVQPSDACLKPDSTCDPAFTRPYHHFELSFRIPRWPFVDERITFALDETGELIEAAGVYGIPECASDPAECDFDRVDAVEADRIAREHGLAAGTRYWETDFVWYTPTPTYAWSVSTTTEEVGGRSEGETLVIDANSGEVVAHYHWFQHSCGGSADP